MAEKLVVRPGDKYNRLTILEEVEKKNGHRHFLCECDCGNRTVVDLAKLRNGRTKSCGCLAIEIRKSNVKHGLYYHPLYRVWNGMIQRCTNTNQQAYNRYGGRGITVCREWTMFEKFYEWAIKSGYQKGLTVERKNNDGNYCPENCRWATMTEQSNNRKSNRYMSYDGKTMTIAEWARHIGVRQTILYKRIWSGWSIQKALETPVKNIKGRC